MTETVLAAIAVSLATNSVILAIHNEVTRRRDARLIERVKEVNRQLENTIRAMHKAPVPLIRPRSVEVQGAPFDEGFKTGRIGL